MGPPEAAPSKRLDFEDFYAAILIKAKSTNGNLSESDKGKILSLKDGMNLGRTIFKCDNIGPQTSFFIKMRFYNKP